MDGEGRIPPLLVAGLVFLVLAIGALAYYAGRFERSEDGPVNDSTVELPPTGPPDPAVVLGLPTPAEVPPTVPPSVGVVIENTSRSSRVLVERSSQIDVPVPAVIPTARVRDAAPTPVPTARRQIVVQIVSTPVPLPTPTPEDVEPEEGEEEDPPPPYATPEPTTRPSVRSAVVKSITALQSVVGCDRDQRDQTESLLREPGLIEPVVSVEPRRS